MRHFRASHKRPTEWLWIETDKVTKWVQATAFLLAGTWALFHFIYIELPNARGHIEVQASMNQETHPLYQSTCQYYFYIKVTNKGITPTEVDRVRLQGWQTDSPPLSNSSFTFLNWHAVRPLKTLFDTTPQDSLLYKSLAPGESIDESFPYAVQSLPLGEYLFSVTVYSHAGLSHQRFTYLQPKPKMSCP